MPRSSRHKSSHKSQRRSSPVDWSGSDEERASEARVSKDSESEKRKSSHSKETKESNNGYATADHGKKRKDRVESKDESGASDRWDSGLGKNGDGDALIEKRSKADGYSTVDIEKERDKEKYVKEESKSRSSRRHDERSEEKRRYKEEKERDKEREREKEKAREKEKDKEREKEKDNDRERERDRERDRERSSRREKYEEDKREKERYEGDRREKEAYEEEKREKERHLDDKRDKHRYEDVKRDKERYDEDKREKIRHDDNIASRKRESETTQIDDGNSTNKDVDIINETDPSDREQREKHSKRRRDEIPPEEKDKDRERERDRERDREREKEKEKEKEKHRDDHSKSRSSKEYRSEPDKYKDKHRDRDRDDRREKEYYEYKSSREGNRSLESRYKKSKGSVSDLYDNRDEYGTKHKDGHGSKRSYEAAEDRHERDVEKEDVERPRGEYRSGDKEKEKEKERDKEKVDSSPGKMRPKSSPGSISHPDKEQNRHRSKPAESPKKEVTQEDRSRGRTSSTGERTPSRLRDEKLGRPRDDAHSLELSSEIASSTPRSDTHASPKFAPEKSPSNTSLKYASSRGGSGSSKYRERDRDRDRERDSDVPTPEKMMALKREPTPVGTFNRSNSSGSYPPLPYEDGDNRRDSGPDRRFHKRGSHAHGNNNWNGTPNWASQVNNGFMPLPPGPPPPFGFHHFGGPPPPLFGMRPPLKLGPSGVGVPFPMHDPMDRFSGPIRGPYGWHNGGNNSLEDSFPPNLWGPAGNGVFGTEPFWDQNRPLPSWKAQGELLNKELISVSQKEIGATAPASKVEEQSINENLPSGSVDIKVEILKGGSSVETSIKDQELQKVVPKVDNRQETNRQETTVKVVNFWESCIPRAAISHKLVDLELLKKCNNNAAVGELEKLNGASDKSQADLIHKKKRNGMSIIVLKSLFTISKDENFQKAMSLYHKLSKTQTTEKINDLLGAPDLEESEVHNISLIDVEPDLGNNDMEVDKKVSSNFVSDCDSVIFKAGQCDQVMKESSEDGLSRIPISTENTH